MTDPDQHWTAHAACRQHDPDLWFASTHHGTTRATQVCHACPVQQLCLDDALHLARHTPGLTGIWAGKHATELRRATKNTPPTTPKG